MIPPTGVLHPNRSTVVCAQNMLNDTLGWLNGIDNLQVSSGSIAGVAAFVRTSHESRPNVPNVQYFIRPLIMSDYETVPPGLQASTYVPSCYYNGIMFGPHLLDMKSRGNVDLLIFYTMDAFNDAIGLF